MISKILNIDALDSQQLNLTIEPVNLSEILHAIVDRFKIEANKKKIIIGTNIEVRVTANIDKNYVEQVLENIISNALKFSPFEKKVQVNLSAYNKTVTCEIKDEGPSLSASDMGKLFGKYQKLSAKPTGNESRLDWDYRSSKKFVVVMHGKILSESEQGKGASFFVTFPRA